MVCDLKRCVTAQIKSKPHELKGKQVLSCQVKMDTLHLYGDQLQLHEREKFHQNFKFNKQIFKCIKISE